MNYQGDANVFPNGISLSADIGTVQALRIQGIDMSTGVGTVDIQAGGNVFVNATENGLQTAIGLVEEIITVDVFVAGLSATIQPGLLDANPDANVIGQSLSTNINGVTIDDLGLIGSGWGRELWGSMVWGDAYSVQTGSVSAQTAINGVTTQANADVEVQGQSLSITTGNELPEADANVFPNGISLSADIGTVQALRIQGIDMSTGVGTVDIQAGGNVFVNATENGLQTTVSGDTFVFTNYIEEVNGVSTQINIGNETVQANANVDVTGNSLTTEIGDEFAFTDVTVAVEGQQLATFIGNETAFTDVTVELTGQSITGAVGDITPVSIYSVTGISLTANIGSVTVQANADVDVTGISLTTAIGSPRITAWAEVDTGTDVTWTEVDLAA